MFDITSLYPLEHSFHLPNLIFFSFQILTNNYFNNINYFNYFQIIFSI